MAERAATALWDVGVRRAQPGAPVEGEDATPSARLSGYAPARRDSHGEQDEILVDRLGFGLPALTVLRDAVADRTLDERIDDPYLVALAHRIGGTSGQSSRASAFDHARAWLLRRRFPEPRRDHLVGDWRSSLGALVAGPAPEAGLLVDAGRRLVLDPHQRNRLREHHADDLALCPPVAPLLIGRLDTLVELEQPPLFFGDSLVELGLEVNEWEADLIGWLSRRREREATLDPSAWLDFLGARVAERVVIGPEQDQPSVDWRTLDRLLGSVWLALRRATPRAEAVEIAGGAQLLLLGGGVCASIVARTHTPRDESREVRAAFLTRVAGHGVASVWPTREERREGGFPDSQDAELPRGLYVRGPGVAIDIRFVRAPWLMESPTGGGLERGPRLRGID